MRLPTRIGTDWTKHLDIQIVLTFHQQICIHIACIQKMFVWKKSFLRECVLNWSGKLTVGHSRWRGFYVSDHMKFVVITRFGDMNFVSRLDNGAFIAIMGFWIIRRVVAHSCWRQIFCFAPTKVSIIGVVLKHPTLSKKLNSRKLFQKCRG